MNYLFWFFVIMVYGTIPIDIVSQYYDFEFDAIPPIIVGLVGAVLTDYYGQGYRKKHAGDEKLGGDSKHPPA